MEYTKEQIESMIKDISPELVGAYAKNFREVALNESISKFAKKTPISEQSIRNFEAGRNVSYETFYEYAKRGFLQYVFG